MLTAIDGSALKQTDDFILATTLSNLFILPADRNLTGAEIEMVALPGRESQLRRFLTPLRDRFDHIFIDCPPSLGLLTLNALVAAESVMIPLHCEYFALEGLADLMTTLRRVRAGLNPTLDVDGVLLTMYDERTNLGAQVAANVREFFKEKVFETVIPRNVRLAEAPSHGLPVTAVRRKIKGRGGVSRPRARIPGPRFGASPPRRKGATNRMNHSSRRSAVAVKLRGLMEKRPALGKGLSALIPDVPDVRPGGGTTDVDVDQISPSDQQPRHRFEDARLDELAQSIKANGVIQPIVVRKVEGGYRIIAGERRWRAAQRAGLTRVPVVVKDVGAGQDAQLLQMALIENIQREDLNPMDEAVAYEKLSSEFSLTQEDIAAAVGKDRSSVANHMRLLKLPQEVRAEVAGGRLSMGHARALLALEDEGAQRQVAREVIARNLSVRETETMVKRMGRDASATRRAPSSSDVHTRAAEEKLRMTLGTRVRIARRGKGGRIEIDFTSEDELHRLYEHLTS